ncbi:MAG: hypothetical protein U0457_20165 [Candidatus Sericytochromatia bacterium]
MKLSKELSSTLRKFSFWLANGTVGLPLLENIDYTCIFSEPSALEQVYAIFVNVLEIDEKEIVLNAKEAEYRASQFIRSYIDENYEVEPEFEDWEVMLY